MDIMKFSILAISILIISGCGLSENSKKIQEIAFENCACDEVRISYLEENFRTTVYMEIFGSDIDSKKEVAIRINEAMKKEIDDYCSIDKLELDFINKGEHEIIIFRYCKIDN